MSEEVYQTAVGEIRLVSREWTDRGTMYMFQRLSDGYYCGRITPVQDMDEVVNLVAAAYEHYDKQPEWAKGHGIGSAFEGSYVVGINYVTRTLTLEDGRKLTLSESGKTLE